MGNQKSKGNKKWLTVTLCVIMAVLLAVVGGGVWVMMNYHIVDGDFYAKDAEVLDLRGQDIQPDYFEKVSEKLPESEIRWDIPFQDGKLADDAKSVTVTALSEKDIEMLAYAHQLETVQAEGCRDYEILEQLRQQRPELEVIYNVAFSSTSVAWNVETLNLEQVAQEDIQLLKHLPNLKQVTIGSGTQDAQTVEALRSAAADGGMTFGVTVGSEVCLDTETALQISGITDDQLQMLPYLTGLEQLQLMDPQCEPQQLFALREAMPRTAISWEVKLGDQTLKDTVTSVDLSMVEVTDLAEVEKKLAYLPDLETVIFGLCGKDEPAWGNSKSKLVASPIENEAMSDYRNRVRGDYKVVWTVRLGPSIALRTDADNFMPNHFGVGQLPDSYAYNLRYCEDMVCLDVGHMTLRDISFVEFMPNLKYLILAWTEVQYIEPIRSCKNLVFLELDNSCIRDISPLVGCTALEDLNLGNTFVDVTPILEMSWLKNVYFILGSPSSAYKVSQAIPTAHVVASGDATVGGGWRRLPNYYAMRDCLNMPYMN